MRILPAVLALAAALPVLADWELKEEPGKHLDVRKDGVTLARFMTAHDPSTKESLHETYKPYLHLFDPAGQGPITKGAGGDYTHHRGIFIGWSKISCAGKTHDRWHMKGGEQVHQKFLAQTAGGDRAIFTSLVHWNDEAGQEFIIEERTMTVSAGPAPAYAQIDFTSKLSAPRSDVKLDGDPEHAGIHFRPANHVERSKTLYVFPRENANAHKDKDYPWVGETFTLAGRTSSVVAISHVGNPSGTRWSAYRDYGRFGAFPTATIKSGESVTFKYRFLIAAGEMLPAATIQKSANEFSGTSDPTPKTTVLRSEQPKAAAKPDEPKK